MTAKIVSFPTNIVSVDPSEAWVAWVESRRSFLADPSPDHRAELLAATHRLIRATNGQPSDPGWRLICEDIDQAARSFGSAFSSPATAGDAA